MLRTSEHLHTEMGRETVESPADLQLELLIFNDQISSVATIASAGVVDLETPLVVSLQRYLAALDPNNVLAQLTDSRKNKYNSTVSREMVLAAAEALVAYYTNQAAAVSHRLPYLEKHADTVELKTALLLAVLTFGDSPLFAHVCDTRTLTSAIRRLFTIDSSNESSARHHFVQRHMLPTRDIDVYSDQLSSYFATYLSQLLYSTQPILKVQLSQLARTSKSLYHTIHPTETTNAWKWLASHQHGTLSPAADGANEPETTWQVTAALQEQDPFIQVVLAKNRALQTLDLQKGRMPSTVLRNGSERQHGQDTALTQIEAHLGAPRYEQLEVEGQTVHTLTFKPVRWQEMTQLLTAVAPLSFVGRLARTPIEATYTDWTSPEDVIFRDFDHSKIPGWSEFLIEKSALVEVMAAAREFEKLENKISTALSFLKLYCIGQAESSILFKYDKDLLSCAGKNTRELLFTALFERAAGATDAERVLSILMTILNGKDTKETQFELISTIPDGIRFSFRSATTHVQTSVLVAHLDFTSTLAAENQVRVTLNTGTEVTVVLSELFAYFSQYSLNTRLQSHIITDAGTEETPLLTPVVYWTEAGKILWQSSTNPKHIELNAALAKRQAATDSAPSSRILGGLALAAQSPAVLEKWWKRGLLGSDAIKQEMSEAQVVLFPQMFSRELEESLLTVQ